MKKTTFEALNEYLEGATPLNSFIEIAIDNKASTSTIAGLLNDAELDCICDAVEFERMTYGQRDLVEKRIESARNRLNDLLDLKEKKGGGNFAQYIRDSTKVDAILEILHRYIDNKKGNNALVYIYQAIEMKWILKPPYKVFVSEFGEKFVSSQFTDYLSGTKLFSISLKTNAKEALEKELPL